jgi:hypothetical protein
VTEGTVSFWKPPPVASGPKIQPAAKSGKKNQSQVKHFGIFSLRWIHKQCQACYHLSRKARLQ